ncbi:hypothetical protein RHGRI_026961 [Rhododendron griersonianum]|uniref:Uncharacterized protein n=1 Tax=Rhododendron griersonianum TaxID=479676 RepID=A0AAV6IY64_9ERIC|nr:hypothetical protein RHGRI_026961 [Rhododendron griersonianum]
MAEGRAGVRGGRGGRTAYVDEVYERDDAARDARAEERFQPLKRRVASVIQRLEALEVGRLPRHQPFKPSLPTEVDFSDGVSITKPLLGNHQSAGRTRAVKVANRDSRLWESGLKINFPEFQKGMTPEKILKESPPRFDEYADDEFEICEANVIEDIVHVAIQEDGTVGKIIDGSNETKFMSLDSTVVKKNIWIAYFEQFVTNNIDFILPDSSLEFGVRKINLRYKIDADKLRWIQLYKLEDEFLQAGENDVEWELKII